MKVSDGKGSGREAEVTGDFRLKTDAMSVSELHENSLNNEQVYMFSTGGFISITTTGTETGIFYLKNTSTTRNLTIHSVRTCGNQIQKVIFYKNPTGGTLLSDETAAQSTNLNFKSSNTSEATVYKGADAKTVSGGTHIGQHVNNIGHSSVTTDDAIILGRNDSLAVSFELASAGDVCVAVVGYFEND